MALLRKIIGCGDPDPSLHCDYYVLDVNGRVAFSEELATNLPPKRADSSFVRFVVVSDTHEMHHRLLSPISVPDGDVFLHCGDILLSDRKTISALSQRRMKHFFAWVNSLPHRVKIVVAGNHDQEFQKCGTATIKKWASPAIYSEHEIVEFTVPSDSPAASNEPTKNSRATTAAATSPSNEGIRVRCLASPWSSGSSPNRAFQEEASTAALTDAAERMGATKESGTLDVVVTHLGAPCHFLREILKTAKPQLHFGGHAHELHGSFRIGSVPSFNAAMLKGKFGRETIQNVTVVDCEV